MRPRNRIQRRDGEFERRSVLCCDKTRRLHIAISGLGGGSREAMGDLHSVAITPFSTMGAGGPRLSMKNSKFNTPFGRRIGIKTSETAAKRYGVATLPSQSI